MFTPGEKNRRKTEAACWDTVGGEPCIPSCLSEEKSVRSDQWHLALLDSVLLQFKYLQRTFCLGNVTYLHTDAFQTNQYNALTYRMNKRNDLQ